MANSAPQPNNVALKFRRQSERERMAKPTLPTVEQMPDGDEATPPAPIKAAPKVTNKRLDKLRARGLISDKQAERFGK